MRRVSLGKAVTKLQAVIVAVVIIVAVAASIYYYTLPPPPTPTPTPGLIKIGVLCPLSPPGAYGAGAYIKRGALIAEKYLNERGGILGRPVNVIVEDDAGTPEVGIAAIEKLITRDKVTAVVGQYHSSVMLAVQDVAERYGIPIFGTQCSSKKITEKHLKWTFRTHCIDPDRAKLWSNWIKDMGFKRIAIIAEDTDYGIGLIEAFKEFYPKMVPDIEAKHIVAPMAAVDLTPQLLEIKAWNPDLVINIFTGAAARLCLGQSYDIGLFPAVPQIGAHDWPLEPEFWEALGEKGQGVCFVGYYHPRMYVTDLGKEAIKMYYAEYGESPIYASLNCFGQINIIAQAIEMAKSDKPEDIRNALMTGTFINWNSEEVKFQEEAGPWWHQWSSPMLIFQFTELNQAFKDLDIIYPPESATAELKEPPY